MKIINNFRKDHNYMVTFKLADTLHIEGWHNEPDKHWLEVMKDYILNIKKI